MNELLIQFAWKTQAFQNQCLVSDQGQEVKVFKPGRPNTDAGPDFTHAHVKIGEIEWHGAIEIHLRSSDWYLHRHHHDPSYEPVVLHVVWENDRTVIRMDGTQVPVVELKNSISPHVLSNYEQLISNINPIPCAGVVKEVPEIYKRQMMDASLAQRFLSKKARIIGYYESSNHDLEETAYRLLARNFGFRLNADAFERLAHVLPLKILLKHKDQPIQMEALSFGMAGMLDSVASDPYTDTLKREFEFLGYKYGLLPNKMSMAEWKFLRTRPSNFPTLRVSQWVNLLIQIFPISSFLKDATPKQLLDLGIESSPYWNEHYMFGKHSPHAHHRMGKSSKEGILINSVVPILLFYAEKLGDDSLKDKALRILEILPSEDNAISRLWESLGFEVGSAFDSQALIEHYQSFCLQKKCLQCAVGAYIIRKP